ncbi:uncharacterized protein LOC129764448 [Toxorhynchites rutilus septentrionalis]|uniref:uncharacterized protein LOC129764448 n=1 Tax=Toxorhynchites rutilus septentrionalis TaxID=329112 RepID=UPI0024787E84|nr:uncharacterized protein LOC129764448 [Toxorhynchites rutilus septentrionalis]
MSVILCTESNLVVLRPSLVLSEFSNMLVLLLTIFSVLTVASAGPIPSDSQNTTITNIEDFFQHSLNGLAGALISQHNTSSPEHYQSTDGSIHAVVKPLNLAPLQAIAFRPNNNQLILHNATNLFKNESIGVDLIQVDLKPSSESTTVAVIPTSTEQSAILEKIPTSIVSGIVSTNDTSKTNEEVKTTASTTGSTRPSHVSATSEPIEIVTPVQELHGQNVTAASVTEQPNSSESSQSAESSESKEDLKDKIKEVEAEPVILTAGV